MSQKKILILIVTFISLIAIFSFFSSPVFQLRSINLIGLKYLTENEVEQMLSSYLGDNIWLIDKKNIRNQLFKNNYIKEVKVIKKFPDSLTIKIHERTSLGKINNNGKYIVFDIDGFVLEEGPLKTRVQVPEIKGVGYSFSGNRLIFSPLFAKIVQALDSIDQKTRTKIKTIKLKDEDLEMDVLAKLPVYLGNDSQLVEKFRVLQSILDKVVREKLAAEYIDLRIIQKPVIKLKK